MDEPAADRRGSDFQAPSNHDRLDSWKQIAVYLGRGVTTVQRWEQEEGLPVRRLAHAKKGSVFAFKSELDAWLAARSDSRIPAAPADSVGHPLGRLGSVIVTALAGAAVASLTFLAWHGRGAGSAPAAAPLVLPRPLLNGIHPEITPTLSPDGTHVVYARVRGGGLELFVKPVDGGLERPLPTGETTVQGAYPAWSPRGDMVAFLSRHADGRRPLYLVSPHGGTPRMLTTIDGVGLCWSPDGGHIAFADRTDRTQAFAIYSLPVAGGERRRLTSPPPASFGDTHCSFSPDGRWLAVTRYETRHKANVFLVDRNASGALPTRQLTDGLDGIRGIAWTPTGDAIVAGAAHGLWRVPVDGRRKPVLIAGLEGGANSPSFSRPAAGRPARLVYQYYQRDVNIWRWMRNGGRSGVTSRITDSTWFDDFPSLSPDGTRIVFASNRTSVNELWVANADGSNARQLTFFRGPLVISPQWSPDGRRIAFSSESGGNRDIYVIDADGSALRRLTAERSDEGNPSWSRDGQWIYFRSDRTGLGQLWKVPTSGGAAVRVTEGRASQGFESSDGTQLYFVRSVDVPGVWTAPVGGGKEALVLPDVREGYWGVTDRGIAYLSASPVPTDPLFELRSFDVGSRTTTVLTQLRAPLLPPGPGFSVSRDGKIVLWTQGDTNLDDVMLIDPWVP